MDCDRGVGPGGRPIFNAIQAKTTGNASPRGPLRRRSRGKVFSAIPSSRDPVLREAGDAFPEGVLDPGSGALVMASSLAEGNVRVFTQAMADIFITDLVFSPSPPLSGGKVPDTISVGLRLTFDGKLRFDGPFAFGGSGTRSPDTAFARVSARLGGRGHGGATRPDGLPADWFSSVNLDNADAPGPGTPVIEPTGGAVPDPESPLGNPRLRTFRSIAEFPEECRGTPFLSASRPCLNIRGVLRTAEGFVPVGEPVPLQIILTTRTGISPFFSTDEGGLVESDWCGSIGFPTTGPVFDLPDGFTVNSRQAGIVDNRIPAAADAVPEPATLALLAAGLGGLGWLRARRVHG